MRRQRAYLIYEGVTWMNRLVVMTVGKTHSGKTTFARSLEKEIDNSVVIDQDNHAEFLQRNYQTLVPTQGANVIKYAITQTILDYAVNETTGHLILCNSNRNRFGRLKLLEHLHSKGFTTIIVNFNIPEQVLRDRVNNSRRTTTILRTVPTFKEVLTRQDNETNQGDVIEPREGEADHLFTIQDADDVQSVIQKIVNLLSYD